MAKRSAAMLIGTRTMPAPRLKAAGLGMPHTTHYFGKATGRRQMWPGLVRPGRTLHGYATLRAREARTSDNLRMSQKEENSGRCRSPDRSERRGALAGVLENVLTTRY